MSADPEIQLPPSPSDERNENPGINCSSPHLPESVDSEKEQSKWNGQGSEDDADSPFVYHYLTFATELPPPTSIYPPHPNAAPPPECPNLKPYEDPFTWSEKQKRLIIWISCIVTAATAFTAGSYSPGVEQYMDAWGVGHVAALVGITVFTCGFGIAPMILAPFSEINGRKPVFLATGALFVFCQLMCAITRSYGGMLAARFFVGVGGSTFSTMVGGVVSDIYQAKDRNTPMTLFSAGALIGTGLGPLVCGFVAQHTTWRWIFYLQTIMDGSLMVIIFFVFKETRGSILLSRKAKTLNK
ncbi:hypothetical protein LTS18_014116, partial [Coniosporium uncinatum]